MAVISEASARNREGSAASNAISTTSTPLDYDGSPTMRLLLIAIALCSCEGFNDQCTALVKNPNDTVVTLAAEVFLDRPNARSDNNAIGQATADAFVDAMNAPG